MAITAVAMVACSGAPGDDTKPTAASKEKSSGSKRGSGEGEGSAGATQGNQRRSEDSDGAEVDAAGGLRAPKIKGDEVLDVALQEPATLDPMRIQDPGAVLVARQLYEGLTRWDPDHSKVKPAAARSWSELDEGSRFVFKLRKGMRFHDGSAVTAGDFKYAFERIALKRNASDLAFTLELVKGFNAINQFGDSRHLAGITTPDSHTLVIELSKPYRDFPAVLTHPALVPLPRRAAAKENAFARKPVGNGTFRLAGKWSPGAPIALEAFDRAPRKPRLDGIRFVPYTDAAASWPDLVSNKLDIAEVPASEIETAAQVFGDEGYQPLLAGYYYGFNLRERELKSKRRRRAIGRAVDRDEIANGIYDRSLVAPRGIVPAGMPGFSHDACKSLCDYSKPAARRMVRKIPKARRHVTVEYTKGRPHGRVAHSIAADLRSAGLRVKVKAYGFDRYLERLRGNDYSMYRLGWIAEYPVADVFLGPLFQSGSPDNHSHFRSGAIDDLLAKARRTASEKRRAGLYRRAEKKIMRRAPIVPIGSFVTRWVAQDAVRGVSFDVMGGFDAARASLIQS